jgi:CHASE1-domain containing sensor protein
MQDLEVISKRKPIMRAWPLLAVGVLGVAVGLAAWIAVSVWEERLGKAKFDDVADDYATVLQGGLNDYLEKIQAVGAFFDASYNVTRREFDAFTGRILERQGDTIRLVWCPRVTRGERDAFERRVRDNGLGDFSIKTWAPVGPVYDAKPREEYFAILYSTVSHARTATFGTISILSKSVAEPSDVPAMKTSWPRRRNIQLRNPIGGKKSGFIVFLPVYKRGQPHNSVVSRRQNIEGVIAGGFSDRHGVRCHSQASDPSSKRRSLSLSCGYRPNR